MTIFEMNQHDMLTLSETLSSRDIIINICDSTQNPGQTWIFYKAGQTWLTQAKRDPVDPSQLQHWYTCLRLIGFCQVNSHLSAIQPA